MIRTTLGAVLAISCISAFGAGPVAVKVAKPETITEGEGVPLVGRVEGSHNIKLSARVVGTLWECNGEEGKSVKKGDVIYRIEDTVYKANLQTAKAELAELEAKLSQAEIEAKRYTDSETKGGVSKSDRDRVVMARDVARAAREAALAKVTLCENDLSYCTIRSPVDGVLGRDSMDIGNNVSPANGTLRDVISVDPIDVTVSVPEQVLLWAFESGRSKMSTRRRLLRSDGKELGIEMEPYAFDNKVDSSTGTVLVRFRGRNPERTLMPGGYVKLVISEIFEHPKLVVPMSAVVFEGDDRFLYVVAGGKATKRKVKLGCISGNRVIVEEGLTADEKFAAVGVHKLADGVDVKEI